MPSYSTIHIQLSTLQVDTANVAQKDDVLGRRYVLELCIRLEEDLVQRKAVSMLISQVRKVLIDKPRSKRRLNKRRLSNNSNDNKPRKRNERRILLSERRKH